MSYELVKSWIDDQSSVTEDQINEAAAKWAESEFTCSIRLYTRS